MNNPYIIHYTTVKELRKDFWKFKKLYYFDRLKDMFKVTIKRPKI